MRSCIKCNIKMWISIKKLVIGSLILSVLALAYAYVGGFNEVAIQEHESAKFVLQGKMYEGSAKNGMGTVFDEINNEIKASNSEEILSAYFYNAASEKNDFQVKVFIGATLSSDKKINPEFEVKEFELGKSVSAGQRSNPIFTKVYRELFSEMESRKILLDSNIVIEQYPREDSLVIWVPKAI